MNRKEKFQILFLGKSIGLEEDACQRILSIRVRMILELLIGSGLYAGLVYLLYRQQVVIRIPGARLSGTENDGVSSAGAVPEAWGYLLLGMLLLIYLLSAGIIIWHALSETGECVEGSYLRQAHKDLLDFMRIVRSQRHDFNLHMQAISNMIGNEDYGNCRDYLAKLIKNVSATNEAMLVSDPVVSALLSAYYEKGQMMDVDMQFDIGHTMEGAVLNSFHLNTVLGNLLQNALDEVEHYPDAADRWVLLYVMKRGRKLILKVTNPFHGDPAKLTRIFEMGYSTKKFHEGVGLPNVKRILNLKSGSIHVECGDREISVIAQIPLNLS